MPSNKIDRFFKKLTLILICITLIFVSLIFCAVFYSRSQLKLGVRATDKYVNAIFKDQSQRKNYGIPEGVELKNNFSSLVDYGIRGAEIIYPCVPQGHIYVTFNATKGVFLFALFNGESDFDIQVSDYDLKDIN